MYICIDALLLVVLLLTLLYVCRDPRSNSHGQLGGARASIRGGESVPKLLLPALFPRTEDGNEIVGEGGGLFAISKWNYSCRCSVHVNASLPRDV